MPDVETQVTVDDRRRDNRIDAYDVGLRVVNSIDGEELGIIGNLSQGGMMLITTRQLFPNGVLQLRIENLADPGETPITLGVKVLWCVPANSPNEYWTGLETIDAASADRMALQRLLDQLAESV
jgi:hypothetical protein